MKTFWYTVISGSKSLKAKMVWGTTWINYTVYQQNFMWYVMSVKRVLWTCSSLLDHQRITQSVKRLKYDIRNNDLLYYYSFYRHTRRENCNKKSLTQEKMILCKDFLKCKKKFETSGAAKANYNTFYETKECDCQRCRKIFI